MNNTVTLQGLASVPGYRGMSGFGSFLTAEQFQRAERLGDFLTAEKMAIAERVGNTHLGVGDFLTAEQLSRAENISDYLTTQQLSRAERVGQYPSETLSQYPIETGGIAQYPVETGGLGRYHLESGLGFFDWVTKLFGGKPQSWWDRLNSLQSQLIMVLNEVTTFPKNVWNGIQQELANMRARGEAWPFGYDGRFPNYEWVDKEGHDLAKRLIASESHVPTDEDMDFAARLIPVLRGAANFATKFMPEYQAQIAATKAKVEANLAKSKLRSPAEAGQEEFVRALQDRADMLSGKFSLGLGTVIGLAALALGVYVYSTLTGGRD